MGGDTYFFFGVYEGYDIWVELEEYSYVNAVKGNVFYSYNDWGKVHNKKPISDFDPDKQLIIYNVSLESNKWIYSGLIIENGEVVVDRNVEEEAK